MNPVFVHDPRKGETLAERFSLHGNPDISQDWTTQTISYTDTEGLTQVKQLPFTPADFALHEGRFKKQFHALNASDTPVEIADYIALSKSARSKKVPFIWATDKQHHLIQLGVSDALIALTEERLRYWHMLQYISGQHLVQIEQDHQQQLQQWEQKYQQAVDDKEQAIDTIANGLAELALATGTTSSKPAIPVSQIPTMQSTSNAQETNAQASNTASSHKPLVFIDKEDQHKCTNCQSCYQQLSELFEKTTIIDNGVAKVVSQVIPGALEHIEITDDLISRAARVADECGAEIIQFNTPKSAEALL